MVDLRGIEPLTSALRTRHSPSWAKGPSMNFFSWATNPNKKISNVKMCKHKKVKCFRFWFKIRESHFYDLPIFWIKGFKKSAKNFEKSEWGFCEKGPALSLTRSPRLSYGPKYYCNTAVKPLHNSKSSKACQGATEVSEVLRKVVCLGASTFIYKCD